MSGAPSAKRELLTGWGLTAPTGATVKFPASQDEAVHAVGQGRGGIVPRGLGRSYGDAAQVAGGVAIDTRRLRRFRSIDLATGIVDVEAGVSIEDLITRMLPFGWFVPVTPGTRYVTVGGAIAADIHGKNHHVAGSFGSHVQSMDLLLADGTVRRISADDDDPALFWATVGGMGLTGIVLSARVRLKQVPSSLLSVDTERAANLDELMAALSATDHRYTYSVAWIDCMARGASMGRSVITRGDFAALDQLGEKQRADPYRYRAGQRVSAPRWMPNGLLNKFSISAFNELWYRKAPRQRHGQLQSISAFFHPLDMVGGWNRIYGSNGFLQYQFVVPYGAEDMMRRTLEALSSAGTVSFLAVLKRFGEADPAPLSFPSAGWTLALDIPAGLPGLAALLDRLDEQVVEAGGRIYLAKDSRVRPELLPAMYPRLDEWRAVRSAVDPDGLFTSDLARRLHL
jgi:decaprenylphospho-beta-D-ribofuranose 2-oxidase